MLALYCYLNQTTAVLLRLQSIQLTSHHANTPASNLRLFMNTAFLQVSPSWDGPVVRPLVQRCHISLRSPPPTLSATASPEKVVKYPSTSIDFMNTTVAQWVIHVFTLNQNLSKPLETSSWTLLSNPPSYLTSFSIDSTDTLVKNTNICP